MKLASKFMTDGSLQRLVDQLTLFPRCGVILKGTGGLRKIRWKSGKDNRGKSGGLRVVYYYHENDVLILLLTVFRKTDCDELDNYEKRRLKEMLPDLIRSHKDVETWSRTT